VVECAPEDFLKLPVDTRTRILDEMRSISELVYQHTGAIIISPPPSRAAEIRSASCSIVEVEGNSYLLTAEHVLARYEELVAEDDTLEWQVGDLRFKPDNRVVLRDRSSDFALVQLRRTELPLLKIPPLSAPAGWPPPSLKAGDYVAVAGFPGAQRQRLSEKRVHFDAITGIFRVTTVGDGYCMCQWEREHFVTFRPPGAPPEGADLAGMSGGPVLLIGGIAFPLVGAVSEFQKSFEILRLSTLWGAGVLRPVDL
jgi:S1-C subfamily serine protease